MRPATRTAISTPGCWPLARSRSSPANPTSGEPSSHHMPCFQSGLPGPAHPFPPAPRFDPTSPPIRTQPHSLLRVARPLTPCISCLRAVCRLEGREGGNGRGEEGDEGYLLLRFAPHPVAPPLRKGPPVLPTSLPLACSSSTPPRHSLSPALPQDPSPVRANISSAPERAGASCPPPTIPPPPFQDSKRWERAEARVSSAAAKMKQAQRRAIIASYGRGMGGRAGDKCCTTVPPRSCRGGYCCLP
jgi:hypothetical protein